MNSPLEGHYGEPIFSQDTPRVEYVGRVVVEMWNNHAMGGTQEDRDRAGIAVLIDPAPGAVRQWELYGRIMAALPRTLGHD